MAAKRKNRTISHDALALRHALQCSIPALRRVAVEHVRFIVEEQKGSSTGISRRLGIAISTWWEWVQAVPQLKKAYYANRPENAPGPVPAELAGD